MGDNIKFASAGSRLLGWKSETHREIEARNDRKGYKFDADDAREEGTGKTIVLWRLDYYDYEIKGKMSSILKHKYAFNSLSSIRKDLHPSL